MAPDPVPPFNEPAPRQRPAAWRRLALAAALLPLLPVPVVLALRWVEPPTTAFMLQSEVKPVRHAWVPSADIAGIMKKAVIAAEDQKFRDHWGFDFESIADAFADNRKRRRVRGASTITQQTAKNLFLWPGGGYLRKGIEAWITLWIELLWPKDRILETYLNIAEFGPGTYGVEAAARQYFGKGAAALTPREAARLTAVLPSPRNWSVLSPGPYVISRTDWILAHLGYGPPPADEEPEPPEFPDPLQDDPGAGFDVESPEDAAPEPEGPAAPARSGGDPDPAEPSEDADYAEEPWEPETAPAPAD